MQADSFFTKGTSHKICEDYTMHGLITDKVGDSNPYAILCDGCSGSDETDFGARLLARSAKEALKNLHSTQYFDQLNSLELKFTCFERIVKEHVFSMLKATNSVISTIDATLLLAFVFNKTVYIYMRGDGAYAYKLKNSNDIHVCNVSFTSGAPYYLSYDLNVLNDMCYENLKNNKKIITHTVLNESSILDSHKTIQEVSPYYMICNSFPVEDIEFVSITSDGVGTFQYAGNYVGEKNIADTDMYNAIFNMTSYKNCNGTFVDRRMNNFMREKQRKCIENFDDVSSATIHMD